MDKKSLIMLVTAACVCVIGIEYFYENFYQYDDIKNLEKKLYLANSMELWNKGEIVKDKEEIDALVSKLNNVFSYRGEGYFFAKNRGKKACVEEYVDKRRGISKYVDTGIKEVYIWIKEVGKGIKEVYTLCNFSEKTICTMYIKYMDEIIKDINESVLAYKVECIQGPSWTPLERLISEKGGYIVKKMYYNDELYYILGHDANLLLIIDKNGTPLFNIRCGLQKTMEIGNYDKRACDTTQNAKLMTVFKDVNKDIDFGDMNWINEKNISVTEFVAYC